MFAVAPPFLLLPPPRLEGMAPGPVSQPDEREFRLQAFIPVMHLPNVGPAVLSVPSLRHGPAPEKTPPRCVHPRHTPVL
jgi:hypothetical protein